MSVGQSLCAHHAASTEIVVLAERQKERLLALGLDRQPFALSVRNTVVHAAMLKAAAELRVQVVLAPNGAATVLGLAQRHAGAYLVVELENDGSLNVSGQKLEQDSNGKKQRSTRTILPDKKGWCAVATSGTGQAGSQLVAYSWDKCDQQAAVTVQSMFVHAAPCGGRIRFIAASSIGHAYNLNGLFAALKSGAELCLPGSASELSLTLFSEPVASEATVLFATPRMYTSLLQEESVLSGTLQEMLREHSRPLYAFSAGCPLPCATQTRIEEVLGVPVMQNYGTSETGIISAHEIHPSEQRSPPKSDVSTSVDLSMNKGSLWGKLELRPVGGGTLLPPEAEGEVTVCVEWASEGYLINGSVVPHDAAPFVRTGDAGKLGPISTGGHATLIVMQRLRTPLEVWRAGLRLLVQPYEVEEALLRCNPAASAAAALQGPGGQLLCAVASVDEPTLEGQLQPDKLVRMDMLPMSPAGKILHSVLYTQFLAQE